MFCIYICNLSTLKLTGGNFPISAIVDINMPCKSITKKWRKGKKEDLYKVSKKKMNVVFNKFHTVVNMLPQKHSNPQKKKIIINILHYDSNFKLSHRERKELTDKCIAQKDK